MPFFNFSFSLGRFWPNFGFTSQLDELLKKENVTVEDIMDEETILSEIRGSG